MTKRVVIVHQWGSSPSGDWYPWLAATLKSKGVEVEVPKMPEANAPKIDTWVSYLSSNAGMPDADTYFVGHSVGCQTILRYLEMLTDDVKVGGVLMIAPWLKLKEEALGEEEIAVARPWLDSKIDWKRVRVHTDRFVVVISDDDPYVPMDNKALFESHLGARVLIQRKGGHFEKSGGFAELHVALNELEKMMQ